MTFPILGAAMDAHFDRLLPAGVAALRGDYREDLCGGLG
jgi:hypothetical protein